MPDYIIAYKGGNPPATKEDGAADMGKWQQWIAYLAGCQRMAVTMRCRGDVGAMSGYSVVRADDMDAALAFAKACPFLETGGTLEVAQVMTM